MLYMQMPGWLEGLLNTSVRDSKKGSDHLIGLALVGTPSTKILRPFSARKFGSDLIALHDCIRGGGLET